MNATAAASTAEALTAGVWHLLESRHVIDCGGNVHRDSRQFQTPYCADAAAREEFLPAITSSSGSGIASNRVRRRGSWQRPGAIRGDARPLPQRSLRAMEMTFRQPSCMPTQRGRFLKDTEQ
jgi:hypothetical protein